MVTAPRYRWVLRRSSSEPTILPSSLRMTSSPTVGHQGPSRALGPNGDPAMIDG
jgi:hypothetical protein